MPPIGTLSRSFTRSIQDRRSCRAEPGGPAAIPNHQATVCPATSTDCSTPHAADWPMPRLIVRTPNLSCPYGIHANSGDHIGLTTPLSSDEPTRCRLPSRPSDSCFAAIDNQFAAGNEAGFV